MVLAQIDMSNAFLNGNLEERVVVAQPPGFVDSILPNHACLLKKALYGLKQVPLMWFCRFKKFLRTLEFSQMINDYSLFTLNKNEDQVFLGCQI